MVIRRIRKLTLATVVSVLALVMLLAPSASADTYTDQLVGRFNDQTHVVADAAATPPLRDADRLNQQILASSWTWTSTPPIWVAAVAADQTGVTTADAVHSAIVRSHPGFSGVILVIDAKGYHVRAFNVPREIADSVDPLLRQSARSHRNDPYGATSDFVAKLAAVGVASGAPAKTSPAAHEQHDSGAWVWAALLVVGIALGMAGLLGFVISRNRKRRSSDEAREQIKQELIVAASEVGDLDTAVFAEGGVDVSAESLKANASLADARAAYDRRDYGAARAHLRVVGSVVAKANHKLNPAAQPNLEAVSAVPREDRRQAEVSTRDPQTGERVTINNNNYSISPQPGYPHYYGGGYYNGVFFYPGYYPYAFWGPGWGWALTDVLLMDALLDDHWGGSYDRGFEAGRDSALADVSYDSGAGTGYDSQQADAGFSDGGYSGGGDVDFAGNDFGGGYDSGGGWASSGGYDSGGGFDFGGSDFGGGSDSGGGNVGF